MKKYLTLQNLGWLLTAVVVYLLGSQGLFKVIATQESVNNFTFLKLLPYLTWVGVAEVVSVILLIFNRTSFWGALLTSSIMSAAAVMHLSAMGGTGLFIPVLIGVLAWLSHFLRKGCLSKSCVCSK